MTFVEAHKYVFTTNAIFRMNDLHSTVDNGNAHAHEATLSFPHNLDFIPFINLVWILIK